MNRICYDEADGGGELRNAVRRALNRELGELYERSGIDRREVYEVVVVGNATMRDLFFGLDVAPIGERPYKSITELELLAGQRDDDGADARWRTSWAAGEPARRASGARRSSRATSAPTSPPTSSPSGSTQPGPGVRMLVDVGTNTEVVLGGQRPHPRRELPGRAGLRGRLRDLRHAGRRRRDRDRSSWTPTAPSRLRTIGDAPARRPLRLRAHRPARRAAAARGA